MSKHHSFIDTVDQIVSDGVKKGILHLTTGDEKLQGSIIQVKDKDVVNFGSCSYLGLEFDPRLKRGAMQAIENYGTQFSSSRAYMSPKHYQELEYLFEEIFESPVIVAPTTTLGHLAAIPVLVEDQDAVILDHQVHNSVQTASNLLKPRGIHVELLRHNRMDLLEERIIALKQKYRRIWYMADGIYSMFGDGAPVLEIYQLLNKYPQLQFYVDDAHGMSCYGKHGRGYVLDKIAMHDQMVFATSLAKAFATGGAVLAFPNRELARKVRTCGGPLITSGPMQPGALGAAIASAKIHLSDEISLMQEDLKENIKFTHLMLKKYGLPVVSETNSPVFFIGVSLPKVGYNMVRRMLDDGYYLNLGIFPAVPMKNTGIRFTITRLHTFQQIENMIAAMAHHFPIALAEEGMTMKQIYQAFKLPEPEMQHVEKSVISIINKSQLTLEHVHTIHDINKSEWDTMLGNRGTFDWDGLDFLEKSFTGNELPEENWTFDYLLIRDQNNKTILATFLTTALSKDDMLSPASVSAQVEIKRQTEDPYYLTSKVLTVGSLLTEGEHLYIDKTSSLWKEAMHILFEKMADLQEQYQASSIVIRDMNENDHEMDELLIENGYFKTSMPENHDVDLTKWTNMNDYLESLSPSSKKHVKRYILKYEERYEVEIWDSKKFKTTQDALVSKRLYELYLNVKNNSLSLNTFTLPYKVFHQMMLSNRWEAIILKIKDGVGAGKIIASTFNYIGNEDYNFMVVGIDYEYQDSHKPYKQALYQTIKRAKALDLKNVRMGFTTSVEKKKLGANSYSPAAYVQAKENFNMEVLGNMNVLELK